MPPCSTNRNFGARARASTMARRAHLWVCAAAMVLAVSTAAASESELEIVETFRHYPVTAADAGALHAALSQQRPDELQIAGSHALTEIVLSSELDLEPRGEGCAWGGPRLQLEMRTSLPEWVEHDVAPEWLQTRWNDVLRGLEVHEEGHRRLAREQAIRLLEQIRALDRTHYERLPCREVQRKIGGLKSRALSRLTLRQHSYDERTRLGANQGAVLVLGHGQVCPRLARSARSGCDESSSADCLCPHQGRSMPAPRPNLPMHR